MKKNKCLQAFILSTVVFSNSTVLTYANSDSLLLENSYLTISDETISGESVDIEQENEVIYSVPVKMVQASKPSQESMGHKALDGNATVTIKDGKSIVDLKFKAVDYLGLYGHLLNLWSYPTTSSMDYGWWDNSEFEILAETNEYFEDYGLDYYSGDTTKYIFPRVFRIERETIKEDNIFIRINVDAMNGFDQVARLDFDWANAEILENVVTETIVSAPEIQVSSDVVDSNKPVFVKMNTNTADAKIYYTLDGTNPSEKSNEYSGEFEITSSSIYGEEIVIKAIAIKEGLVNSAITEKILKFKPLNTYIALKNEKLNLEVEAIENSIKDNLIQIKEVENNDIVNQIIKNSENYKAFELDFELESIKYPLLMKIGKDGLKENLKLYKILEDKYEVLDFVINENTIETEISEKGIYILADEKENSSVEDVNEIKNGKYLMDIYLWNSNIDQASMGDAAFSNNRQALVTVNDGKAYIEIATNPVAISGYTSALKEITSSDVDIVKLKTEDFTTNTRYDGIEHTFKYVSKFAFDLLDLSKEFINVEINVPYTPMDGIGAGNGGMIGAKLKLDWSTLEKTDDNASLTPDSSSASGSSTSGSVAVDTIIDGTGIKVEADEFVFERDTTFEANKITEGDDFNLTKSLIDENYSSFELFEIKAMLDGVEVSPDGQVNLYFPIENENFKNIEIFRINRETATTEAGKVSIEYTITEDNKYYKITVKEFGLIALATKAESLEEENVILTEENEVIDKNELFFDIKDHWAYENIILSHKLGLFNGVKEKHFAPNDTANRAMVITVLGRLANYNINQVKKLSFSDVEENAYFYPYISWGVENNIVKGLSEEKFAPYNNITREQLAVMLNNFAKAQNIELKKIYSNNIFKDDKNISNWAKESISALCQAGIIEGRPDNTFAPKETATRAEIATVLVKFIKEYMPEKIKNI